MKSMDEWVSMCVSKSWRSVDKISEIYVFVQAAEVFLLLFYVNTNEIHTPTHAEKWFVILCSIHIDRTCFPLRRLFLISL